VRAAASSRDRLVSGARTARSAATSCRPTVAGSSAIAGTTAGSVAPAGKGDLGRADGTVRVTVARCDDGGGADDHTVAWRCEPDEIDADVRPGCDVQPAHTATHTIAAARRTRRG
jgi:hypothetical protein